MPVVMRHSLLTAPAAPPFEWPNDSNTGVPAGTVLTVDNRSAITQSDLVLTDRHFTSRVSILQPAMRVKFVRCLFTADDWAWQCDCDYSGDLWFEDCTFRGPTTRCVLGQGMFLRCNFSNTAIAIVPKDGQTIVKQCFIHDLSNPDPNTHYDGIFISGGQTDCLVEDCVIDVRAQGGTACVFIATRWQGANIVNTTVNHCRLLGGPSFALYNEQTDVATITGTSWTNNEIQIGNYGYWFITPGTTVFRSGNVDASTGANIDAIN